MSESMLTEITGLCLIAYLCGSIPFGVLLAKTQNINIREYGSGNIGATNVARTMGKKAGLITLAGDVLKGWSMVFLASQWFEKTIILALCGLIVFLGHLFSIFLKSNSIIIILEAKQAAYLPISVNVYEILSDHRDHYN